MYPADFDGIIAGTPVSDWVGRAEGAVWMGQATHETEGSAIPPRICRGPQSGARCLRCTRRRHRRRDRESGSVQVRPNRDAVQGRGCERLPDSGASGYGAKGVFGRDQSSYQEQIFPGLMPGSEMGWGTQVGANPFGPGVDEFKYIVFKNADWDYKTFNFDSDVAASVKADNNMMNAMDPNLKPYFDRGGKILQYHGWADQQMSPGNSPKYYKMVLEKLGARARLAITTVSLWSPAWAIAPAAMEPTCSISARFWSSGWNRKRLPTRSSPRT